MTASWLLEKIYDSRLFRGLVIYETVATIFRQVFHFTPKKIGYFWSNFGFSVLTTDNIWKIMLPQFLKPRPFTLFLEALQSSGEHWLPKLSTNLVAWMYFAF